MNLRSHAKSERHIHQREELYERGYWGCVATEPDECDEAAHGNITRKYRCRGCGAVEVRNINGAHETSGWYFEHGSDEDYDDYAELAFLAEAGEVEDY